ncbi:hypothetical protein GCM10007989_38990 [Devosia pacifica]|uniref:Uncharacterized protein n=1 Tax=Devosia pacifica TaxID=1335967 RepID=A0A918SHA5_9HYPH|nr:hypothetical protein GCM10007989_38990 [Devosia pacifica]
MQNAIVQTPDLHPMGYQQLPISDNFGYVSRGEPRLFFFKGLTEIFDGYINQSHACPLPFVSDNGICRA